MASIRLVRDNTDIELTLVEEGGTPLFIGDFGKPQLNIRDNGGTLNPRVLDQFSGNANYNMVTRLNSYAKANNLADLIKTCKPTDDLLLDIPCFTCIRPPHHPETAESGRGLVLLYTTYTKLKYVCPF